MKKQIEIRIFPDGKIETVTHNMKGKTCLKYLQTLEQLLQARVVDSDFTSEYYEQEAFEKNDDAVNLNVGG